MLPDSSIDRSASKVTGLTVGYSSGLRSLCKDGKTVRAETLSTMLSNFGEFLKSSSSDPHDQPLLLIAHNGNSFDAPRLVINKIVTHDKKSSFDNVYFGDSLPALQKVLNKKSNLKLVDIYKECVKNTFQPHDAQEDCKALKAVINYYGQPLMTHIREGATSISFYLEKRKCDAAISTNKTSYSGKLASKATVEKLSKLGIAYGLLEEINEKCGKEALIAFFASKSRRRTRITSDVGIKNNIIKSFCK